MLSQTILSWLPLEAGKAQAEQHQEKSACTFQHQLSHRPSDLEELRLEGNFWMSPGPTLLQEDEESAGAIRLTAMGQSRISVIIIATINNVRHLALERTQSR